METKIDALLHKIAQLEAALEREQQARKNAAAMAERQKQRVQRLQESLAAVEENLQASYVEQYQMATELKALKPDWALERH